MKSNTYLKFLLIIVFSVIIHIEWLQLISIHFKYSMDQLISLELEDGEELGLSNELEDFHFNNSFTYKFKSSNIAEESNLEFHLWTFPKSYGFVNIDIPPPELFEQLA